MQMNAYDEAVAAELAKLARGVSDSKDWARRILARHVSGDTIHRCTLMFAKQALGLHE